MSPTERVTTSSFWHSRIKARHHFRCLFLHMIRPSAIYISLLFKHGRNMLLTGNIWIADMMDSALWPLLQYPIREGKKILPLGCNKMWCSENCDVCANILYWRISIWTSIFLTRATVRGMSSRGILLRL